MKKFLLIAVLITFFAGNIFASVANAWNWDLFFYNEEQSNYIDLDSIEHVYMKDGIVFKASFQTVYTSVGLRKFIERMKTTYPTLPSEFYEIYSVIDVVAFAHYNNGHNYFATMESNYYRKNGSVIPSLSLYKSVPEWILVVPGSLVEKEYNAAYSRMK